MYKLGAPSECPGRGTACSAPQGCASRSRACEPASDVHAQRLCRCYSTEPRGHSFTEHKQIQSLLAKSNEKENVPTAPVPPVPPAPDHESTLRSCLCSQKLKIAVKAEHIALLSASSASEAESHDGDSNIASEPSASMGITATPVRPQPSHEPERPATLPDLPISALEYECGQGSTNSSSSPAQVVSRHVEMNTGMVLAISTTASSTVPLSICCHLKSSRGR